MKTLGCLAVLFFLFCVVAAIFGLFWLQANKPEELRVDRLETPEDSAGNAIREFKRIDQQDTYVVQYGFVDYRQKVHRVTCGIRKSDHLRQLESFGYDYEEIKMLADRELQDVYNAEIKAKGFAPYLTISFYGGGGYRWKYNLPGGDKAWQDKMESAIKVYVAGLSDSVDQRFAAIKARLFQPRGFQLREKTIYLDYSNLARWGEDPLRHCFQQIYEEGHGYQERDLIGMYLAFFQEIKYEVPPSVIGKKSTQGLWVPTEVVANNHGDCDSKSVAFASMLRNLGLRSIVVVISDPSHALVGVEAKPGPDDRFVRAGNRYYVLCEVAGPGKYAPGRSGFEVKGAFEYQLIEP